MSDLEQIEATVKACVRWLEEKQIRDDPFHRGGFSPYPDTIKSAGTLATADVITFLQRAGIERRQLMDDAINFLVRVQIGDDGAYRSQDGGFPPLGDFEFITNVAFADSTADAVLALLSAYRTMRSEFEDAETTSQRKEELHGTLDSISKSIEDGIAWLLTCFDVEANALSTYVLHMQEEKVVGQPKRYFPAMLAGIAFLTYMESFRQVATRVGSEIGAIVQALAENTCNMLLERRYVPFNTRDDKPSITNTALAIEFIHICRKNRKTVKGECEVGIRKAYQWLLGQVSELIKQEGKELTKISTDFDEVHIDIPEVSEDYYPATYFNLSVIAKLLVEYPPAYLDYAEVLDTLMERLLSMAQLSNDHAWYREFRGREEPATSATASAVYALSIYARRVLQERKWFNGE